MAVPLGISPAGLEIPRHEELLLEIDARFLADTGLVLDSADPLLAHRVVNRFVGYFVDLLVGLGETVQAVYDEFDPDTASGVQASNLARIVGVERVGGSPSQVTLSCAGVSGTVITEGSEIQGGLPTGARWLATETVAISGGASDVVFEAADDGPTTAVAGTAWAILTPIIGWTGCTNAVDAAVGRSEESDADLLRRRREAVAARAGCGVPGIRSRVRRLPFVETAIVIANGENEERLVQGVTLPPNSYLLVVLPAALTTEQEQEILSVLYDSSLATAEPAGTDVQGTVTLLDDGTSWPVAFDYGEDISVTVSFTVTQKPGVSAADARAAIGAEVAKIAPLSLGETLTRLRLLAAAEATGIVLSAEVTINGVDADFAPNLTQRVTSILGAG